MYYFFITLLVLLYLKHILIILILPFQALWGLYQKDKNSKIKKILAIPFWIWNSKIMRGGWERYMIFQIGELPSCHIRKLIYRLLGSNIGKHVVFHFKTEIRNPIGLELGEGTIIGDNVLLDARKGIIMGENVNLSSNVSIYTEQHDHRDPQFRCTDFYNKQVIIGDRAWIGSNVIILPGVKIGEGAVCCAGCVVAKDVDPYAVVAGIPAKKVNERPKDLVYEFNGRTYRLY